MATEWDLCWAPMENMMSTRYVIFLREKGDDGTPWIQQHEVNGFRTTLALHDEDTEYEVAAAPIVNNVLADEELWSKCELVPSNKDSVEEPANLVNFTAGQVGQEVVFQWDEITDVNAEFVEIRGWLSGGTPWNEAMQVALVPAKQITARWTWWGVGSWTFSARVIGKLGKLSLVGGMPTVLVGLQADRDFMEIGSSNEGTAFGGTTVGLTGSAGSLVISPVDDSTPTADADWPTYLNHVGSGTYETASIDGTEAAKERIEVLPTFTTAGTLPASANDHAPRWQDLDQDTERQRGKRGPAHRIDSNGRSTLGPRIVVEVATSPDDSTWSPWKRWIPGALYNDRYKKLRITLASEAYLAVKLTALVWRTLRRNIKWEGTAAIGATGGTVISYSAAGFTRAPAFSFGVLGAQQTVEMSVAPTTSQVEVKLHNTQTHTEITGSIHYILAGV